MKHRPELNYFLTWEEAMGTRAGGATTRPKVIQVLNAFGILWV